MHGSLYSIPCDHSNGISIGLVVLQHRCKNFFTFFYFGHVFYVFNVFFIFQTFFYFKKRWQSSERQADKQEALSK